MNEWLYKCKKGLLYTLVILLLSINKALIRVIPFKKLISLYSNELGQIEPYDVEERKVKLIRHSINRVRKILIWTPVCFEQSLTVLILARMFHIPGTMYFGICKAENGKMIAHAWTQMGNYWVTGESLKDSFTVVYNVHYLPKQSVGRYEIKS